jgi:hypothetical protein
MPQKGYDTKTNRLTDCQSQCDFDFDFDFVLAHEACRSMRTGLTYELIGMRKMTLSGLFNCTRN